MLPALLFFLKFALSIHGPLWFCTDCSIVCSILLKTCLKPDAGSLTLPEFYSSFHIMVFRMILFLTDLFERIIPLNVIKSNSEYLFK